MKDIDRIISGEPTVFHNPCPVRLTLGGCFATNSRGDNLFCCVNSGNPAILIIYNIDRGECDQAVELQVGDTIGIRSYSVVCRADGTLLIASGIGVFAYEMEGDKLTFCGSIPGETAVMHPGGFDSNLNFYYGTYPGAALCRLTPDNRLELIGRHMVPGNYIRGMAVADDKVYLGAMDPTDEEQLYCYDLNTGTVSPLALPEVPSCRDERCAWIPTISPIREDSLFIRLWFRRSAGAIWNTCEQRWTDVFDDQVKCTTSPIVDHTIYFFAFDRGCLCARNLLTKETREIPEVVLPTNALVYNMGAVQLRDQKNWPGMTIVANTTYYGLFLYNIETGHWEIRSEIGPEGTGKITLTLPGEHGELFCSLYQGQYAGIFYPDENRLDRYTFQQVEGALYADSVFYMGRYLTDGGIASLDPAAPYAVGENPKLLSTSHGSDVIQDRVFQIADTGTEIAYGSVPDYGLLGGCVAFWDKKTGETTLIDHTEIAPQQSIIGLAYFSGKLYGTTGVFGGLGIDPTEKEACAFRIDAASHHVELVEPLRTAVGQPLLVAGSISVSPEGRLFAAADHALLELDRNTLQLVREIHVGDAAERTIKDFQWRGYNIAWVTNTICVSNIGYHAYLIDTESSDVREIYPSCYSLSFSSDGMLNIIPQTHSEIVRLELTVQDNFKQN